MKSITIALMCVMLGVVLAAPPQASASGTILYDALPGPLPPNLPSLGYQATGTQQFGELIQLTGSGLADLNVTVGMSNWALESTYETVGTSAGFNHLLTLNLYNVGVGHSLGSLIASDTIDAFIPWRPEASPGCGTGYQGADSNCYNGALSLVNFAFGTVSLPSEIIYGLAFNTANYGDSPIGAPGPYNSLNLALSSGAPSVGSNPLPDTAYWDTVHAGLYADGGAGGVGTLRQDTGWTPYKGAVEFEASAVPEPATLMLLATGLLGLIARRRGQKGDQAPTANALSR